MGPCWPITPLSLISLSLGTKGQQHSQARSHPTPEAQGSTPNILPTVCAKSLLSPCAELQLHKTHTHTTRCCGAASSVTRSALWDKIPRPFLKKGGGGFYVINALAVKIVLIKMYNNLYSV